jgi:hypothetical protein
MALIKKVELVGANDEHFAWMLEKEAVGSRFGLTLPPGGVDTLSGDGLKPASWGRPKTRHLGRAGCLVLV